MASSVTGGAINWDNSGDVNMNAQLYLPEYDANTCLGLDVNLMVVDSVQSANCVMQDPLSPLTVGYIPLVDSNI